ncbi:hypothetical protein N7G274_006866 [Stereocaulon virgatum]|uniref:Integral membrane protein n=1 Tax=Stereocaulon virgatum TaxID=373712 RepID=A0ABR4A412_9LECA
MVRYLNPGGYNHGPENLDGYGISNITVAVIYSVMFYSACVFLWLHRHHPFVRMRNVPLLLASLILLHGYLIMLFLIYTLNGAWPCQVEYWWMNLYLPIGIGLFQAQNQQLLIVSNGQAELVNSDEMYKPLIPKGGRGMGSPGYWLARLRVWWKGANKQRRFECFVIIGIIIQFTVSFVVYNMSRKFNRYGIVSEHTSPALCRRGWEWAPSVIWQFLWNYFFGPYLLWEIRTIRDIYHWRLQTNLTIVAGLPGTPLWLAAVYTDSFASVNKYWIPGMWFAPGLVTMEIVTLGFPIHKIHKHARAVRETELSLARFDEERLESYTDSTMTDSILTRFSDSKHDRMYSSESLDECLVINPDNLQVYASCKELNGENIIFLTRVITFYNTCTHTFRSTCKSSNDFRRARMAMFRIGLSIFVTLVHPRTASYPINISSAIFKRLESIFGPATAIIAREKKHSPSPSIASTISSNATPWDEQDNPAIATPAGDPGLSYPMQAMRKDFPLQSLGRAGLIRIGSGNNSRECIVGAGQGDVVDVRASNDPWKITDTRTADDPWHKVKVPVDFDENVFDEAFKSVRYMVWTETWQRYRRWLCREGRESAI